MLHPGRSFRRVTSQRAASPVRARRLPLSVLVVVRVVVVVVLEVVVSFMLLLLLE